MNLDEIQSLWSEDSKLDPDNLHTESTNIPALHANYYRILNRILLLKKSEENKFKMLKKEKLDVIIKKRATAVAPTKVNLETISVLLLFLIISRFGRRLIFLTPVTNL